MTSEPAYNGWKKWNHREALFLKQWKGFKNLLNEVSISPIDAQLPLLKSFLKGWKGELEQLDDICMIGVKF